MEIQKNDYIYLDFRGFGKVKELVSHPNGEYALEIEGIEINKSLIKVYSNNPVFLKTLVDLANDD